MIRQIFQIISELIFSGNTLAGDVFDSSVNSVVFDLIDLISWLGQSNA